MRRLTLQLFLCACLLSAIGLIIIYSTSAYSALERFGDSLFYVKRQLLWFVLGLVAQIVCMKVQPQWYQKHAFIIMAGNLFLLLLVLVPGISVEVGGARRWIRLLGFSLQPSEFCKLATIIFVAKVLAIKDSSQTKAVTAYSLLSIGSVVVLALIMAERDLGTTVIMASVIWLMLYVSGTRLRYLCMILLALSPVVYIAIAKYAFRLQRVLIYLDPWQDPQNTGYQIIQSMIAIGTGGVTGQGLGQSVQKYYYLPEAHTDFIFAIYAEETGFVGALFLLLVFVYLITLSTRVALRSTDPFCRYLASGITFLMGIQIFINIGVVTALLPTKGTTLPFVSFGGTSLVVHLMAIGLLISVEKNHRRQPAFATEGGA